MLCLSNYFKYLFILKIEKYECGGFVEVFLGYKQYGLWNMSFVNFGNVLLKICQECLNKKKVK